MEWQPYNLQMIGDEGVEIRGTKVYYLDEISDRGSPRTFKTGTISRATLDRFVALTARSGLFCLADQYTDRFVVPASEPVYEDLTVSIGGDSKTVSITSGSGRGGPSRVRRVIDEIRTVGQSLPSVGGVEFCDRTPTDAVDAISTYCRHELSTLDREPTEDAIYYRGSTVRTGESRPRLRRNDRISRVARLKSREIAQRAASAHSVTTEETPRRTAGVRLWARGGDYVSKGRR